MYTLESEYADDIFGIGERAIVVYSAVMLCHAFWHLVKNSLRNRRWPVVLDLAIAVIFGGYGLAACIDQWKLLTHVFELDRRADCITSLCRNVSPTHWWLVVIITLLLLSVGFLAFAKMFADSEQRPLRTVFGKGTKLLWGLYAVGYLAFMVMVQVASGKAATARQQVEERFQAPLTAEALKARLDSLGKADATFWTHLEQAQKALPTEITFGEGANDYWDGKLPEILTPEILSSYETYCRDNKEALSVLENGFDTVPPLFPHELSPGNLAR